MHCLADHRRFFSQITADFFSQMCADFFRRCALIFSAKIGGFNLQNHREINRKLKSQRLTSKIDQNGFRFVPIRECFVQNFQSK